jgi:hypothetical protein
MVTLLLLFNGFAALLLAVTGGLVVLLHRRIHTMQKALKDSPLFADELTTNMVRAKATLAQLATAIEERGPDLKRDIKKADDALQDLDFVLARADKVMTRLEDKMQNASTQTGVNLAGPAQYNGAASPFEEQIQQTFQRAPEPPVAPQVQQRVQPRTPVQQPARPTNVVSPAVLAHRRLAAAYQERGRNRSVSEDELRKALEDRL